jgi:hypothetical protein
VSDWLTVDAWVSQWVTGDESACESVTVGVIV